MVITIIGILIALLLPAVQAAREAARRMQLREQLQASWAVALHNYHAVKGCFPPGMQVLSLPSAGCASAPPNTSNSYFGWGWGSFILPYVEQQAALRPVQF